jgi:MFS family permease
MDLGNKSMDQDTLLQKTTLVVTTVTAFMAPFLLSSVNVALPAIQHEFKVNAVMLGWIATSYLLATAILLVPIGKYADMHGRRKVFVAGVIVFTLGSLLSVFVPDIHWFIAMRVFQGFGAAMFLTTGMAILSSVFPPDKRGRRSGNRALCRWPADSIFWLAIYLCSGIPVRGSFNHCHSPLSERRME